MLTSVMFAVNWCYWEGETVVRRALYSYNVAPCIEAARLINGNPYTFDVEVIETDSGRTIPFASEIIGRVLSHGETK